MKSTNEAKNTTTKAYLKHSQNETKTLQQNILRMVKTYAWMEEKNWSSQLSEKLERDMSYTSLEKT